MSLKKIVLLFFISSLSLIALDIRIDMSRINARKYTDNFLVQSGKLGKGSIVNIPAKFEILGKNSKVNLNATLNNWIKQESNLREFTKADGSIGRDYFFPVKVESNSFSSPKSGEKVFVALKYLAKNDSRFSIIEESTSYKPLGQKEKKASFDLECEKTPNNSSEVITSLAGDIENILSKVKYRKFGIKSVGEESLNYSARLRNWGDLKVQATIRNIDVKKNCGPLSFNKIKEFITKETKLKNIPSNLMLGVMSQESTGKCFAINNEANGSASVGLFQINTGSSKISRCSADEMSRLWASSEIREIPKCLQNPYHNIKEATRIMKGKYKRVNDIEPKKSVVNSTWSELSSQEKNLWKKAVSAYNGGEGGVFQAYYDLKGLGIKNLDDWEQRRILIFRKELEKNGHRFSNKDRYVKGTQSAMINVEYVDNILGRSVGESKDISLMSRWEMSDY